MNQIKLSALKQTLAAITIAVLFPALCPNAQTRYPGITREQDSLALSAITAVNNLDWNRAETQMGQLTQLEQENELLPLSFLLKISARALRLQNDDYDSLAMKKQLLNEIDALYKKGIALARKPLYPDSAHATLLFIEGGIRGYKATLDIESSPVSAVNQGVKALKCLDSALILAPSITDAYLGSGLFNCILAKYPRFLRYILGFYGKSAVNPDTGLSRLRMCSEEALYSKVVAKQYLIQFLSPYSVDQAKEKKAVFKALENEYPNNPYFLFLELDEALCFYPDSIHAAHYGKHIKRRITSAKNKTPSSQRYENLLKWQYSFIDSLPPYTLTPNAIQPKNPFSYYPLFIDACREKHTLENDLQDSSKQCRKQVLDLINTDKGRAISLLKASEMNSLRNEFFLWHIREGCRIK